MSDGNEARGKVVAILVIVAGVFVTGAALTKWWFMNAEAERRNAETEREVLRLNEAERARELAQDEAVRARAEAGAQLRARIAPMPREKP
jgi:flagellar basal body-associated protein FliL